MITARRYVAAVELTRGAWASTAAVAFIDAPLAELAIIETVRRVREAERFRRAIDSGVLIEFREEFADRDTVAWEIRETPDGEALHPLTEGARLRVADLDRFCGFGRPA